jgi:hypothetical protein
MVLFFGNTCCSYTKHQLRKHYKSNAERKREQESWDKSQKELAAIRKNPKLGEGWGYW